MTTISAASSSYQSPLQKLQDELQAEVNSGAVSSSDQGALSSALTDINASLQGSGASDSAAAANSPPGDLQSKIDNLIAGEVSSGNLTSDQATELQGVFKAAFANGGAGGPDGASAPGGTAGAHHGHHGGHHGGASPADSSASTDSASSAADILQQFLQSLQNSQSAPSTSYSAAGTPDTGNTGGTPVPPLLVDYQS